MLDRATHLVEYKEKETKTRDEDEEAGGQGGDGALARQPKYGAAEWWLLLEPVGA